MTSDVTSFVGPIHGCGVEMHAGNFFAVMRLDGFLWDVAGRGIMPVGGDLVPRFVRFMAFGIVQ